MILFLKSKAVHWPKCRYFLPICKVIFNNILFFDYLSLKDSLQAVLFLMPKNVCERCVTNENCQVECTESFSWPIQGNEYQAHTDALG